MLHKRRFDCSIFVEPRQQLKSTLERAFAKVAQDTDGIVEISVRSELDDHLSIKKIYIGEIPMAVVYSHMISSNGKKIDLLDAYLGDGGRAEKVIKTIQDGRFVVCKDIDTEVVALNKGDLGMTVKSCRVYAVPTNIGYLSNGRTFLLSILVDVQNWNFIYKKISNKMLGTLTGFSIEDIS